MSFQVTITQSLHDSDWYKDSIGETFDVEKSKHGYQVQEVEGDKVTYRYINPDDCETVIPDE